MIARTHRCARCLLSNPWVLVPVLRPWFSAEDWQNNAAWWGRILRKYEDWDCLRSAAAKRCVKSSSGFQNEVPSLRAMSAFEPLGFSSQS